MSSTILTFIDREIPFAGIRLFQRQTGEFPEPADIGRYIVGRVGDHASVYRLVDVKSLYDHEHPLGAFAAAEERSSFPDPEVSGGKVFHLLYFGSGFGIVALRQSKYRADHRQAVKSNIDNLGHVPEAPCRFGYDIVPSGMGIDREARLFQECLDRLAAVHVADIPTAVAVGFVLNFIPRYALAGTEQRQADYGQDGPSILHTKLSN